MKKDLHTENQELKRKLQVAESWMQQEVQNQILLLRRNDIHEHSSDSFSQLASAEMETIIIKRIQDFFSDTPLYSMPESFMSSLVKSEVAFYVFQKGIQIDPLAITIGYQKCLESLIESTLTAGFRKWAEKNITPSKSQTSLEDTLKKVIEKNYILGVGKLYQLLQHLSIGEKNIGIYEQGFFSYLETDIGLKNILLSEGFLLQLQRVVESEVFGSKRHTGEILESEVHDTRHLCTGNLSDKNCLIYALFSTQSII